MSRSDRDSVVTNGSSAVLDDVIEEVANLLQAGDAVDVEAILTRYPEHAESLRRLLPAIAVMAEFGVSASRLAASGVSPGLGPIETELGTLGDFRILREVGRGGMGVVYEAEQMSLHRRVALKVLPFAAALDSQQLRRFKTEAQAAAQLHHTNIVPVFWVGCEQGVHYYAMQFIEGRSLAELIRELRQAEGKEQPEYGNTAASGRISPSPQRGDGAPRASEGEALEPGERAVPEPVKAATPTPPTTRHTPPATRPDSTRTRSYFRNVARLGIEAAEALEHAHQEGIIHRDIKPANLMVDARGHLWVTDFGLARLQNESGLTITGDVLGTLRYMSPEQALGRRVLIDARTDIYSLGVTLYELLTLQPAFESHDRQELLRQIADEEPRAPRKLSASIPRELETIILKAMSKEAEARYATAQQLADDLRRFMDDKPIKAKRPSVVERVAKWARRHTHLVTSALVILVLAVAGLSVGAALLARERTAAVRQRDRARKAVDQMYSRVAKQWLSQQPQLEPLQREFVLNALAFYREFAREGGTDAAAQAAAAEAEHRAAEIHAKLGEHHEAELAYRRAVKLRAALMSRLPNAPEHRYELANSQACLAELLRRLGRLAEAEPALGRSVELCEALVAEYPQDPAYRKDLARYHNASGAMLREQSRFGEGEPHVRGAIEILEALVAEFPKDSKYRGDLADVLSHQGVLLFQMGDRAGAARAWSRAVALQEAIRGDSPELARLPDSRQSLAYNYSNLAVLCASAPPRLEEAERTLRRSLELRESLVADFPNVPEYRSDLVDSYGNLGALLGLQRRSAEAEQALRKAIELQEVLVGRSPGVPKYRSQLGASLNNLGEIQAEQGKLGVALESYKRAIANQRAALQANPDDPMFRTYLRNHLGGMVEVLKKQGDHGAAAEATEQYLRVSPEAEADFVKVAETFVVLRRMAEADTRLPPAERHAKAEHYADRATVMVHQGAQAARDDPKALSRLAWFLATCPDPKFRDPSRAVALARRAVRSDDADGAIWNALGVAEYRNTDWRKATEALSKSMELTSGGSAGDWLFLAMAHWQQGDKATARSWYNKAAHWMEERQSQDDELRRFRDEAAALLGVTDFSTSTGKKEGAPKQTSKP
jgi:serine/threonine protein kinase/Tfp pilus assembly protein PilF